MIRACVLSLLLILSASVLFAQPYAQNLFFSEYVEGSSNNKAIEIFNGTGAAVDLSQYTIKLGSNGGAWSTTNILTPTGTLAHNDVFVIANSQAVAAILAVSDVTSTVTFFNGDDCLGLFQGDTMIDIIGVYQSDPGTAWDVAGVVGATLNHTLIRKPAIVQGNLNWAQQAGTNADDSEWIVQNNDYITDLGTHTFTPGGGNQAATPVFSPAGGVYASPQSVTITCSTPNSSIFYTTDGTTPTASSTPYTTPITVGGTTTLKAIATAPGMDNSYVATAVYTFPVAVATLSELRSMPTGATMYRLTGEAVLTFQQSTRNQKYVQDASAAIVIDDPSGIITTTYNLYDGITGLTGTLGAYSNLLQFTPVLDPGPASSSNNAITPEVRTFASLQPGDQAKLIKVMDVTIDPTLVNFPATASNINATDPTATLTLRTFPNAEYSDTPIPVSAVELTCLVGQYQDAMQVSPRFLADFQSGGAVAAPTFNPPAGAYTAPISVTISSATPGADIYYTTDGSTPTDNSDYYEEPIAISVTTTLKAIATINSQFSAVSTAQYNFPVNVASISALRQSPLQGLYRLTGGAVVSFTQSYRNQMFIQDIDAGILIDDPNDVITSEYVIGDGMSNLVGTLTEFGGMMEFTPAMNPGPPTSTGNQIVPLEVTLDGYLTDFEDYESRVVKIMNVRFTAPAGNFANGVVYPIADASGSPTANFRTTFYDVSYIEHPVYANLINITGIPNSRTDGNYITARDLFDFQLSEVAPPFMEVAWIQDQPNTLYINATFVHLGFHTIPEGLTGFRLYRNGTMIADHAPVINPQWTDSPTPGTYIYHVTAMFGATESEPSNAYTHIVTANPENPPAAFETALLGNYPNPFRPQTGIQFNLKTPSRVRIEIFNQRGQSVRVLADTQYPTGKHSLVWDARDESGNKVGDGIYLYKMTAGKYSSTRKMLMLK